MYAIGHACGAGGQGKTSYQDMSPELLEAGAFAVRARDNFQAIRDPSRGDPLATYLSVDGTPTLTPTPDFTLTTAGWVVFERLREVPIGTMLRLTRAIAARRASGPATF